MSCNTLANLVLVPLRSLLPHDFTQCNGYVRLLQRRRRFHSAWALYLAMLDIFPNRLLTFISVEDFLKNNPGRGDIIVITPSQHEAHPRRIYVLHNAYILHCGLVLVKGNDTTHWLIKESIARKGRWDFHHFLFDTDKLSACRRVSDSVLALDVMYDTCFYHWLYEGLPGAMAAAIAGFQGISIVSKTLPSFITESLQLFGYDKDCLVRFQAPGYFSEHVWLFSHDVARKSCTADDVLFLRHHVLSRITRNYTCKRIYIKRSGNKRSVTNSAAVEYLIEKYNFITLHLEELPFVEQVRYTQGAECLVGPHGAGMSHCAFMKENGHLIEFYPRGREPSIYSMVADMLNLNYYGILSPLTLTPQGRDGEFEIPISVLEDTLRRVLGKPRE